MKEVLGQGTDHKMGATHSQAGAGHGNTRDFQEESKVYRVLYYI